MGLRRKKLQATTRRLPQRDLGSCSFAGRVDLQTHSQAAFLPLLPTPSHSVRPLLTELTASPIALPDQLLKTLNPPSHPRAERSNSVIVCKDGIVSEEGHLGIYELQSGARTRGGRRRSQVGRRCRLAGNAAELGRGGRRDQRW